MKTGKKQVDEMLQLLGQELSESRFEKMNDTNQKQDERIEITPKPRRKSQMQILKVCCIVLCVLIGATVITTVSSEAFRMKAFGFLFDKNEEPYRSCTFNRKSNIISFLHSFRIQQNIRRGLGRLRGTKLSKQGDR